MELLDFEGRVVVITGAGNGLGRAYAHAFGKRGARVVVNDLGTATDGSGASTNAADQVVEEIRALGGQAVASYDSVSTEEGGRAIIQRALSTFGQIDALVSNAGILRDSSYAKLEKAAFDAVLDVHLRGAYFVSRPAFLAMKDAGKGGRIVLTSSAVALFGNFGQANYVAAKLGIVGLTTSLAIEGARNDILTNCIAPMASTRLTRKEVADDPSDPRAPHRVAPLTVYLAHPANTTNGHTYVAGNNYFARAEMMLGQGWAAGPGDADLTPESIAAHWPQVDSIADPQELKNGYDIVPILKSKVPHLQYPDA